jgi:glutamine synthetase
MCDTYAPSGEPIASNKRYAAAKIFNHPDVVAEEPWLLLLTIVVFIIKNF